MHKSKLIAAVAMCVVALHGMAQEEHSHGEMFRMYVIYDEWVKPGMNEDYEAGMKGLISKLASEELKDAGLDFFGMMEEDNLYSYIFPISGFAEIDKKAQSWSRALSSVRGEEAWKKRMAAVSASRYTIWADAPGLSYKPQNPRIQENEAMYSEHILMRVKPGKEAEFVKYAQEIKALFEKHEIADGYSVYRCLVGEVGPVYIFVMAGKDPADYFNAWREIMKKFGAEWAELDKKGIGTYSSSQSGRSWFRPDLSHMPMPQ